jgi:hypothetical protein
MFVLVTVLAIPLGWLAMETKSVQERRALITRIEQQYGRVIDHQILWSVSHGEELPAYYELPWHRKWFGDRAVSSIQLPWTWDKNDLARVQRQFPEATTVYIDRP